MQALSEAGGGCVMNEDGYIGDAHGTEHFCTWVLTKDGREAVDTDQSIETIKALLTMLKE